MFISYFRKRALYDLTQDDLARKVGVRRETILNLKKQQVQSVADAGASDRQSVENDLG
jgi:predicted DNA-binding protein (UPF0251 family)